ncbi:MAG: carboxypeptidase-like regulatory domain-containing protein, partial [Methanococcaceae archaeon]
MKFRLLTTILFFYISINLSAQTSISGVVTDSLNNPIPYAYVYLSKTTIGDITDKNGVYSLIVPERERYELVASCIGYKLNSQIVYSETKKQIINIKLLQDIIILNEVTIKSKHRNKQKDYYQFIKSFIGETSNSQSCKILNPEDLRLFRDSKNNILKGYSINSLKIEKKALGYNILYDLVDFSYNIKTGTVRFSGYNYFQQLNGSARNKKFWEDNRLATYYGSKMHFLRALYSDSLSREGYEIFECKFDSVSNKYVFAKSVDLNIIRFLNTRPFITLLYNDSLLVSYTDNKAGFTTEQLVPQSINKGLFSDSIKRENYTIIKNYTDTSLNDLSGNKPIQENDIKLSSNKNYVTLFYDNPLMISYLDNHSELGSENPILQLDENIRVSNYILATKDEWSIPSEIKPLSSEKEFRSTISFSDTVKLYSNGYFYEPYSIKWAGAMAHERIGDMLPLDFLPSGKSEDMNDIISKTDVGVQDSIKAEPALVAEKVYLHTDRDYYNAGDDIWFKAYIIDAFTNMPVIYNTNLHVELISSKAEIIQSRVLRVKDRIVNGDFHLTDSIALGNYLIRAYTNYMRNFDDHFFFSKNIAVINPAYVSNNPRDTTKYIENQIEIKFFPEGGSLVDSISSVVAFKGVNGLGKGCAITGKLFSSRGDLITTFKSNHLGMGSFTLEPLPGLTYYALVNAPGKAETKASLPKSFNKGATMRATITHSKKLLVIINTNKKTLPLILDRDLVLSISSRNLINWNTKIKITSLVNESLISADDLPEGIVRITLSGLEGIPFCERLIYLQKTDNVLLNVSTDKKVYKPRELVTTNVSLSGNTFLANRAFLSLSATESRFTNKSSLWPRTIASWFLLESDVHGPVEEPAYYFDPTNENRFQDLDLLLLTQGWRDFQWKYDSTSSFSHEFGFRLSGKVERIMGHKSIEGTKINLGLFSKPNQFLSTITDSSGSFTFQRLDFTGRATAFVSSSDKNEKKEGRIFMDSIYYQPAKIANLASVHTEIYLQPES